MEFIKFAQLLSQLEEISSRNEITELLVQFYSSVPIESAVRASYLLEGRVAPYFVSAEFNFSDKSCVKSLQKIVADSKSGIDPQAIRNQKGDIGIAAYEVVEEVGIKSAGLSLEQIYDSLWDLINISGKGSQEQKMSLVASRVKELSPLEAKYYCRMITGKMRLGVSDKTVLDAFSIIMSGDKSQREYLDTLYGIDPDLGSLAYRVLSKELSAGREPLPTPGIPISSRLVERVKRFEDAFERLGGIFYVEPKLDGLRCQLHKGVDYTRLDYKERVWSHHLINDTLSSQQSMWESDEMKADGATHLFSRNLEDMTHMFPELVKLATIIPFDSVIFDGEVIGYDYELGEVMPFQETITRKRKHGVEGATESVPIRYFVFDILFLDGKSLLDIDYERRREVLGEQIEKIKAVGGFKDSNSPIVRLEAWKVDQMEQVESHFAGVVEKGYEGLVAKQPTGGYQPGKRNYEWIKLKKSMDSTLVDEVDLVVMGYYYGSGKKAVHGMGALLAGVYNSVTEQVESVTKIGTGITDSEWEQIAKRLNQIESEQMPANYVVGREMMPDVWVAPDVVVTVEADEITVSKLHKASLDGEGRGLALRFPRLKEFDRDKNPQDATSSEELRKMFQISKG